MKVYCTCQRRKRKLGSGGGWWGVILWKVCSFYTIFFNFNLFGAKGYLAFSLHLKSQTVVQISTFTE